MPQFIDVEELTAAHRRRADRPEQRSAIDRPALERDLRAAVQGEVRFDRGSLGLYATDGSNYRQVPIGVVIPRTIDDVVRTMELARRHGAPVLSRGGGTSLSGQCCNVAIVMDFSKYLHHILELDPDRRWARVQPGLVLDDLRHAAERHHLTFGPDPSTHNHCTLGGMIGNNSCGTHSVMAGETCDNVEALDILTYDGLRMTVGKTSDADYERILSGGGRRAEIYRRLRQLRDRYADEIRAKFPKIPRRVSGYNLPALLPENGFHVAQALVGTESTCVTVLGGAGPAGAESARPLRWSCSVMTMPTPPATMFPRFSTMVRSASKGLTIDWSKMWSSFTSIPRACSCCRTVGAG